MRPLLLLLFTVTLLASCRYVGGKRVRGNGNLTTSERSVSSFNGVSSFGSFDITLIPSSTATVKVEADENLHEYIETYVDGGNLKIKTRNGYNLRPRRDIRVTVSGPTFNTIETHGSGSIISQGLLNANSTSDVNLRVAGSGNIEVDLNAGGVDGEIAGSGNIKVRGKARVFEGDVMGSGNIRAADLETEESKVEIAGSGNVEVYATNKLDVRVMGSGEVKHRGNARVNTKITGSGSVVKMD